jgi:hypothetical protein
MNDSIWPTIHAERRALADDLVGLTPEQWATQSLCTEWASPTRIRGLVDQGGERHKTRRPVLPLPSMKGCARSKSLCTRAGGLGQGLTGMGRIAGCPRAR